MYLSDKHICLIACKKTHSGRQAVMDDVRDLMHVDQMD